MTKTPEVLYLSSKKFVWACFVTAVTTFVVGRWVPLPAWLAAAEVMATVLSLFIFGSTKVQIDKNALTYGAVMVIGATVFWPWWYDSGLRVAMDTEGPVALLKFSRFHFFSLKGLERLVHIDTMLFILGLTYFVAVIAQTRLLETLSHRVLQTMKGQVLPTVGLLAFFVAAASGILDGVSMIGLLIRTLIIILLLGRATRQSMIFAVMVSTVITTVSGMWLAYGEPPNLIMKTNLFPHLSDGFFLRYCLPVAIGSYLIVLWNMRTRLRGKTVDLSAQDVLDSQIDDVRFLQAMRHGDVLTPLELLDQFEESLAQAFRGCRSRVLNGEMLGTALIHEQVPRKLRLELLGHYTSEGIADELDLHYSRLAKDPDSDPAASDRVVRSTLGQAAARRLVAQKIGLLAFIPFIVLLVSHAIHHDVPLFFASFAGFAAALVGIWNIPRVRALALREGAHEYKEYLFLFPLFLSISLLQKTGFFDQLASLLDQGIHRWGTAHMAYLQFWAATFLSAILDNNVVADFASKALHNLEQTTLHLFAMAQIAGYAVGGTWTHIGCAQSVVAYAFIKKEIDPHYTPFQWMKTMTGVVLQLAVFATVIIYLEGWILSR